MQALGIIFEQTLIYLPLVLGAYCSISLVKVPDLSIEAAYVFGAILGAKTLSFTHHLPGWLCMLTVVCASLFGGLAVGLVSAILTKVARLPHLLSAILTVGLFHGINQFVLGTANFSLSSFKNPLIISSVRSINPELLMLCLIGSLLTLVMFFFLKTQLGLSLAVYGNNPRFFDHYHVSGRFVFFVGLGLGNALAGLSGYFFAQTSSFTDVGSGFGIILFCVTALILGRTFVPTKKPIFLAIPLIGVFSYCALQQLLLKVGFNLKYFTMIQSLIVLCILINKYRSTSTTEQTTDNLGV